MWYGVLVFGALPVNSQHAFHDYVRLAGSHTK